MHGSGGDNESLSWNLSPQMIWEYILFITLNLMRCQNKGEIVGVVKPKQEGLICLAKGLT